MSQYATPFAAKMIATPFDLSTKQGIFDHVASALLKQGMKSMSGNFCAYRGALDTKCAAGHLMPDGRYRPGLEGRSISTPTAIEDSLLGDGQKQSRLLLDALDPRITRDDATIGFIQGLQSIHDLTQESEWPLLRRKLGAFGGAHGLDVSVIPE